MKEGSWDECLESGLAAGISPDKVRAKNLMETARARMKFVTGVPLSAENANFVFENCYTSVLEMLTSVILLGGHKIENHVCAGFYLRDVLKKGDLFILFDHCRSRRNALVYYGRKADFPSAKDDIAKARQLMGGLSSVFDSFQHK